MTVLQKAKPARTRLQKTDDTRRALFDAAAMIVGQYGYADASVVRITAEAGVANGTFYNYFETRQHLFDQLLPVRGEQLLQFIREQVGTEIVGIQRERLRITAYFEFCALHPGFLRILNEAEVFAPLAYERHLKRFAEGYLRALKRSRRRGEIAAYDEGELEAVVHMLMGARAYLTELWNRRPARRRQSAPADLVATYLKLLEVPLFAAVERNEVNGGS